jgi:hypothetical protein
MSPSKKDRLKSISVAIAKKLGFLSDEKAKEADEAVAQDGNSPTLALLVDRGYLDQVQAAKIRSVREKESPSDELTEAIKRAKCAMKNSYAR